MQDWDDIGEACLSNEAVSLTGISPQCPPTRALILQILLAEIGHLLVWVLSGVSAGCSVYHCV